jgi:hypothetical protein
LAKPQYVYNLSGSPLSGTTVTLPRAPRWGRKKGTDEHNIIHQTNRGKIWAYRLFEVQTREYVFRFPESEYDGFLAFHQNVQGQLTPFYWVFESETLLVRKEAGFSPQPTAQEPYMDGATLAVWYDYTLTLTEESPGLSILA